MSATEATSTPARHAVPTRRTPTTTPAGAQERALAAAFAARVRALREQKNLSQGNLAHAAGLSISWLGRVESSPRTITLALIDRLRRALDVSYDELLGDLPPITERYTRANRTRYVYSEDAWPPSG